MDGVLFGDRQMATLPGPCDSTCAYNTTVGDNGFAGSLGNVVLYPSALSDLAVANLYATDGCVKVPTGHYCVDCDNPSNFVTTGDVLHVTVTVDTPIRTPTIVCHVAGGPDMVFTVVTGVDGDLQFNATYTVQPTDISGAVTCDIPLVTMDGQTYNNELNMRSNVTCSQFIGEYS